MRRSLVLVLCASLPLQALPASAQYRSAPLPKFVAPASWSLAASAPALHPALSAPPLAAPAPLPTFPSAPALLAPPSEGQPLPDAVPAAASPARLLETMAVADGALRSAAFDGTLARSGGLVDTAVPIAAPADAPRLSPGPAPRARKSGRPAFAVFQRAAARTALAAPFLLALWNVMPTAKAMTVSLAALVGTMAALAVITVGLRLLQIIGALKDPAPPAGPAKRAAAVLAGALLGASLVAAPLLHEQVLVTKAHQVMDGLAYPVPPEFVRPVPGRDLSGETVSVLSQNPMGRAVLDGLRDRGGELRLPKFYVSRQHGSHAAYYARFDAVYVSELEILEHGWTVEAFMSDPALQRRYVAEHQATLLHELTHAVQYRRSPFTRDYWSAIMEREYEAFVNAHLYTHARLKADPTAPLSDEAELDYLQVLADLSSYLSGLDGIGGYALNGKSTDPRWAAWRRDLVASWPAHQVEGYLLLARRHDALGQRAFADNYRARAAAIAQQNGLPIPAEALPKR